MDGTWETADRGAVPRADSIDRSEALSLDNIRQALIRQEDTIIFSIIERAQVNLDMHARYAKCFPGHALSGRWNRGL